MPLTSPLAEVEPPHDCALCPRLVAYRAQCREEHPGWWNAPVPAFGDPKARIVLVGLAPGKQGANRTGRPFTGDYAGDLLFGTLAKFGLSGGVYDRRADDGLSLKDVIILNSVKCLPPQNKPAPDEIRACRCFLERAADRLPRAHIFIALGRVAHDSAVRLLKGVPSGTRFGHGAEHAMPGGRTLIDSYHCSRYNTQTGRLTVEMFEAVFARAVALRDAVTG